MSSDKEDTMAALIFEMRLGKLVKAYFRGKRKSSGYWKKGGPISIKEVPIPKLIADDWVLIKTVYCGICGSDMKELTLSGARDNPLRSLISFPQIMGHEPVGIIEKVGPKVKKLKFGDRVAISPWLSCKPRGIIPECSRCQQGDYTHCKNFQNGNLPQGMHLGVTPGFGGFASHLTVHESQCFVIPENVTFDQAVLADPFSVAFHSCLILDPNPDSIVLIYGLGVIGLSTILCLNKIFNIRHILALGRYEFQKEIAEKLGAEHVFMSNGEKLIEEIAHYLNIELFTPEIGYKWTIDGVDGIIDTIASAETLEIGIRILSTQGKLVFSGVNTPKRTENTPHYFKELEIIGSNAFSIENFNGERKHAFDFYLKFLKDKEIDPSLLISHKFPLEKYQDAFNVLANKRYSQAIKVLFDFTNCKNPKIKI